MSRLVLLLTACWLLQACRHDHKAASPVPFIRCYIMAGQSNMAGRGAVGSEDTVADLRVLSLSKDNNWRPAREPLHFYQPNFDGLDCGRSFGIKLLELLPEGARVGLLPCAVGSTGVADWLGDSVRIVPLYSNLLQRAAAARAAGGEICGLLWHQGEQDAGNVQHSGLYEERLKQFILRCRSDLGNPRLPFFLALLADFNREPFRDSINAALRRTAASLPSVYLIDTHDLSCKPDSLHFDSEAQREMGRRFAMKAALIR